MLFIGTELQCILSSMQKTAVIHSEYFFDVFIEGLHQRWLSYNVKPCFSRLNQTDFKVWSMVIFSIKGVTA